MADNVVSLLQRRMAALQAKVAGTPASWRRVEGTDVYFLIRPSDCRETLEMHRAMRDAIVTWKHLTPEGQEATLRRRICRTVLVGWIGMRDKEGRALPFSPEAAEEVFAAESGWLGAAMHASAEEKSRRNAA